MSDITENQAAAEPATSAPGEPVSSVSAPLQPASSGSTDTPAATQSTAPTLTQTSDSILATTAASLSTTAPVGTVGEQGNGLPAPSSGTSSSTSANGDGACKGTNCTSDGTTPHSTECLAEYAAATGGEQGNAGAGAGDLAPAASASIADSLAADAASRVLVVPTPSTDSQTSSPTGGPIAGRGDTPEAKAKHGFLDRVRDDLHAELTAIEGLPRYVLHVLEAVFDRHHSHIDNEAQ